MKVINKKSEIIGKIQQQQRPVTSSISHQHAALLISHITELVRLFVRLVRFNLKTKGAEKGRNGNRQFSELQKIKGHA